MRDQIRLNGRLGPRFEQHQVALALPFVRVRGGAGSDQFLSVRARAGGGLVGRKARGVRIGQAMVGGRWVVATSATNN